MEQGQRLAEFTAFHDRIMKAYEDAFVTCRTAELEEGMAEGYHCYFGRTGQAEPACYSREDAIAGLRQSFAKPSSTRARIEGRTIRLRGEDEATVFYEKLIVREEQVLARLFTIECFRRIDGNWRVVREIVEHLGA